ncbi:homeotic protein empty spiracles-like [Rattus rattus]|uniref:homeotic protein empty spiracles-like n=1 Tax=Rattus rattus TaxID=10117 RepID=UPI0013F2D241|nr:homeotic protein empty spiracles-like [Rattus rattus]
MQEPTDYSGFLMQNAAPTILPTNRISGPPTFPDLQMPPAQLVPHSRQMPQIFPLLESLQMPPGSPVNPGFQVFPSHFPPHPQVDPHPGPQVLSNAPMREWRGRIRYSPEQKRELENFFKNSKYPSFKQRKMLAQSICVMEYQIRIWFKNRRSKYFREHPEERQEAQRHQGGRAHAHHTSTRGHVLINSGATGHSMSPNLEDVGSLLQPSSSDTFPSILQS